MDVEEFVKETLRQIASGVKSAQPHVDRLGGVVVPRVEGFGQLESAEFVEFDVAVTVSKSSEKGGKLEIAGFSFVKGGGGAGSQTAEQFTSRVRFKVPILLPSGDVAEVDAPPMPSK